MCASATGTADAIRSYPGPNGPNKAEIDAILMSVGTIHHLIEPRGARVFERDEKRNTSSQWGRGGVRLR